MSDEFDDAFEEESLHSRAVAHRTAEGTARQPVPRLVSRVYRTAGATLRARMLACLLRPLGSLGLVAVASGAFANFLYRRSESGADIPLDELGRYSNDQIFELARFVEQVNPEAIQQVAGLLVDSPVGVAAFGAAAAMMLVRIVRGSDSNGARTVPPDTGEATVADDGDDGA